MTAQPKVSSLSLAQAITEHRELTGCRKTLGGSRGLRLMTRILEAVKSNICPKATKYARDKGWPLQPQN